LLEEGPIHISGAQKDERNPVLLYREMKRIAGEREGDLSWNSPGF
jgi:hypothetical protein